MIIERPTQQPTTERVEVCDWCGVDKDGEVWHRMGGLNMFTFNDNELVFHVGCWKSFVIKHRASSGLKPLGGDDPKCIQTDCEHPTSWHEGHPNYGKPSMTCVCVRLQIQMDGDPLCKHSGCRHPLSWHGNLGKCNCGLGFKA